LVNETIDILTHKKIAIWYINVNNSIGHGKENEVFSHPLSPYVCIVKGLFDVIDKLDFTSSIILQEKKPLISGREHKKSVFQVFKEKFNPNPRIYPNAALDVESLYENNRISAMFIAGSSSILSKIKRNLEKLKEDMAATLPLFNILLSDFIPETSITEKIGPDGRTLLLSELLVKMINKIAEYTPIAIVIDDTQWMDSASWAITLHIVRRCKRVFIVNQGVCCFSYQTMF
jgi:hypothetical protein